MFAASALINSRARLLLNVAGYLENPAGSWLWEHPGFKKLFLRPNVVIVDTCMCTFGARWRKPTRLMFWNCSPSDQFRMCKNASGLCDFTHRKHVVLSGAEKGVFRTSHAQVYPVKFAQALAESLLSPPPGP